MAPRPRTKDKDLPPRVYKHGRQYRFVPVDPATGRNGKPISLGRDKTAALRRWAELLGEQPQHTDTIAALWARYNTDELPRKAAATQHSARQQSKNILTGFGQMSVHDIKPTHAIQYLDRRGKQSPTQANREIALLRHMLTKAVHWGLIERNPLLGLQYRNPERPRERYVTDDELAAAMDLAKPWLRCLLWLAYLTALRRGDLLRLTRFNLKPDGIETRERKTKKRVIIQWTPDLRTIVDTAIAASPDDRLFPVTESGVNNAWTRLQKAIEQTGGKRFQLKDLRAKHATDFEETGGDATNQLGHSQRAVTTRHYLRKPRIIAPISTTKS